jgi:hypothetical protein
MRWIWATVSARPGAYIFFQTCCFWCWSCVQRCKEQNQVRMGKKLTCVVTKWLWIPSRTCFLPHTGFKMFQVCSVVLHKRGCPHREKEATHFDTKA